MAITSYGTLKTAIASRIDRADQTTAIEDAIDAATMRLTRDLRVYDQEARSNNTLESEWTTMPSDFNGVRLVRTQSGDLLEYHTPESFQRKVMQGATPNPPIYTIEDAQIRVLPAPSEDSPLNVQIVYHQKLPELSDSLDTNWLLTDHPDIYLAASMVEILLHLRDEERAMVWEQRLQQMLVQAIVASRRRRYSGSTLVVRAA